jgi:hypothetical protein
LKHFPFLDHAEMRPIAGGGGANDADIDSALEAKVA